MSEVLQLVPPPSEEDKREHRRAQCRAYYAANRERRLAENARWRSENKERVRAGVAKWSVVNKEKIRAHRAAKYAREREKIRGERAAYRLANRALINARQNAARAKAGPVASRLKRIRLVYGLAPAAFAALIEVQDGRCAICRELFGTGPRDIQVDHDHKTGRVRGLLCPDCNTGLGRFRDNTARLDSAIRYLQPKETR